MLQYVPNMSKDDVKKFSENVAETNEPQPIVKSNYEAGKPSTYNKVTSLKSNIFNDPV